MIILRIIISVLNNLISRDSDINHKALKLIGNALSRLDSLKNLEIYFK